LIDFYYKKRTSTDLVADLSGDIWVHVRGDCAVGGNPCMEFA